jgi:acetate kinase
MVRARVCRDLAWLGIALDDDANAAHGPLISLPSGRVSAFVVATDEERMIARHTDALRRNRGHGP